MFSPDIESSVVLILGFLTSRLSIYKFPCLQISQKKKSILLWQSVDYKTTSPVWTASLFCVYAVPGKEPEESCLFRSCFSSWHRVNKMHTFCCWGSPQWSQWSQGVSFNAFAKETLWHGPHLRISDCFPLDMQTSGEPHMQMQPQCRKHVAVCKEASACLACMWQCCLQQIRRELQDRLHGTPLCSESVHHELSRVSSEHLFPGHVKLSICDQGMKVMGVWVCICLGRWIQTTTKKGLKWSDLILKNVLENHLEKYLNYRCIKFRWYQFFWWFWLH